MAQTQNLKAPVVGAEQVALLERLCNACAVSGDEREVRQMVLAALRPEGADPLADDIRVDALGSVLAIKHAKVENPLRVMLDCHMDEVGFMIVADDEGGLFRFVKIGGIDNRALPGKTVLVGKDNLPGVIGAKPIHLTEPGETDREIPLDALRIDVGPGGGKVKVGDRATFATRFREIGPSFIAKGIDNRIGVATLIEILKNAPENVELLVAFSVQEEIGLRGARAAAYGFNPDVAIAVDTTASNDLPTYDDGEDGALESYSHNAKLGLGPAIYVADPSTLADPRLVRLILATGDELKIPYQVRQPGGGSTDAGAIHKVRAGVPSISMSVPVRYIHTAAGMCRRADWENLVALLWNVLARMDRATFDSERL